MKIFKALIMLGTLTFFCFHANSGTEVDNGGGGIYCEKNDVMTVVFYDLFEAEAVYGLNIDLPDGKDELEIAEALLERMENLDSVRRFHLMNWFRVFYTNVRFTNNDLIHIPDIGYGEIPPGCELKQVIVQRKPSGLSGFEYVISKPLWDLMDKKSKAVAIVHELILRDFVENSNQRSSEFARYFNGLVMSDGLSQMSLREYHSLLKRISVEWGSAHGFPIALRKIIYYDDHTVKYTDGWDDMLFSFQGRDMYLQNSQIGFYPNARIEYGTFKTSYPFVFQSAEGDIKLRAGEEYSLNFYESGELKSISANSLKPEAKVEFEFSHARCLEGCSDFIIKLHKSGFIRSLQARRAEFLCHDGWQGQPPFPLEFYKDGTPLICDE